MQKVARGGAEPLSYYLTTKSTKSTKSTKERPRASGAQLFFVLFVVNTFPPRHRASA